jgi:hypothetical protein
MHPYLIDALASGHRADLRREADAQHRGSSVVAPHPVLNLLRAIARRTTRTVPRATVVATPSCCPA